jgi:cytochrome P450
MRHLDAKIYKNPEVFRPERFLAGQEENKGVQYSWVPFSAGVHKCSGYVK